VLSLRAASRTPISPRDLRFVRPGVRCKASCSAFFLAGPLPSTNSAGGSAPPLFAGFAGSMDPSDFLSAFISAVPSVTFSERPAVRATCHTAQREPTGFDSLRSPLAGQPSGQSISGFASGSRFSRLEFRHMPGSTTPPCPDSPCHGGEPDIAFPFSGQDRHTGFRISELNGWPAPPLADATPATLLPPAYGPRPELLAGHSLYDSFILYSKPVYPGAFPEKAISCSNARHKLWGRLFGDRYPPSPKASAGQARRSRWRRSST